MQWSWTLLECVSAHLVSRSWSFPGQQSLAAELCFPSLANYHYVGFLFVVYKFHFILRFIIINMVIGNNWVFICIFFPKWQLRIHYGFFSLCSAKIIIY